MDLNTIWYLLVGVLIGGYAILDGFDLGVGILYLGTKREDDRLRMLNAIGPVWDGNEVWLLTAGGALFAAFPRVYGTVFSGFYLALILVLMALIFRAVSLEFRRLIDTPLWRGFWDKAFGIGSLLPAILFGVAFGNILRGIPVTESGVYVGSFFALLNPLALLVGLFTLAYFIMHGAVYMVIKAEGELQQAMRTVVSRAWVAVLVLYIVMTAVAMKVSPYMFETVFSKPLFWLAAVGFVGGMAGVPFFNKAGKPLATFVSSALIILMLLAFCGLSLYPRIAPSSFDLAYSLTIYNASSSPYTLKAMLIITCIGLPLVLTYTAAIYYIFRGKAKADGYDH